MRIYYKDSLIHKSTTKPAPSKNSDESRYWWPDYDLQHNMSADSNAVTVELEVFCKNGSVRLPKYDTYFDNKHLYTYEIKTLETNEDGMLLRPGIVLAAKDSVCNSITPFGFEQIIESCDD